MLDARALGQLENIRRLSRAGRGMEALALCEPLVAAYPKEPEVWFERGQCDFNLGRFENARRAWTEALRIAPGETAGWHNLGSACRRLNDWAAAETAYAKALECDAKSVESRLWLADCLQRRRAWDEAEKHYKQASIDAANNPRAWVGLGLCCHQRNRDVEAVAMYERAAALDPQRPEVHLNWGTSLRSLGCWDEAVARFREAIRLRPDYDKAHFCLGMVHVHREQWVDALAELTLAVKYQPSNFEAHDERAKVLLRFNRVEEAIAAHREALRIRPNFVNAMVNLGVLLSDQRRFEEARTLVEKARELRPDIPEVHNNLGTIYKSLGHLKEAESCFLKALQLRPKYANAHYNLGNVFLEWARWDDAEASFERALAVAPHYAEPRFERGVVRLTRGQFAAGWDDYEYRWEMRNGRKTKRTFDIPAWNGEPLAGRRLLIYTEQGFGDTFQFLRYADQVKRLGAAYVAVECQPKLLPLLRTLPGVDQWVPRGEPLPNCDLQVAMMSLPRLCGTRLDSIPASVPYLTASPKLLNAWRERLSRWPGFRIGIAWQGSPTNLRDLGRSIPLRFFEPLARVPGVRLISLQRGTGVEQLAELNGRFPVETLGDDVDAAAGGFMDTAAIVKTLDLVVSSDTSLVHLCGALGANVWVALSYAPEWRWLIDREDSPWYPTMRLKRQRTLGDWDELFKRIAAEVAPLAARKGGSG
ncbi:MAG: hypothetical protein RLY70_755 [Planctomycetota bacterium]|jgi:tetratricopeptide (TPR) repeat protein